MRRLSLSPQEWRWAVWFGPAGLFLVAAIGVEIAYFHKRALFYTLIGLGELFMAIPYLAFTRDGGSVMQVSQVKQIIANRIVGALMLGNAWLNAVSVGQNLFWW
jgi:hypothetical protein